MLTLPKHNTIHPADDGWGDFSRGTSLAISQNTSPVRPSKFNNSLTAQLKPAPKIVIEAQRKIEANDFIDEEEDPQLYEAIMASLLKPQTD